MRLRINPQNAGPRRASTTPRMRPVTESSPQLKDQTYTTAALRVNFLVVRPVRPVRDRRSGDLVQQARPAQPALREGRQAQRRALRRAHGERSATRWTAANRATGLPYEGPIAIGDGEVLLRAFAEADGLETKAEFRFPAKGKKGVQIDDVKPGRLVSRTGRKLDSRAKTFEGLKQAAEKSATFEGIVLTVGQGNQMIAVNVGEIAVDAAFIEALLAKVLEKFTPDTPGHHDLPQGPLRFRSRPQGLCRQAWHRLAARGRRAMTEKPKTVDFGAPDTFGAHLFRVEIPASRTEPVVIVEDYGYRGQEGGIPREEERVVLEAPGLVRRSPTSPAASSTTASRPPRCSPAAGTPAPTWWTACSARNCACSPGPRRRPTPEQLPVICSKWAALRPEERWWLFAMTVAEAGLPEDTQRGWRRALFHALSDGEKPAAGTQAPPPGRAGPVQPAAVQGLRMS